MAETQEQHRHQLESRSLEIQADAMRRMFDESRIGQFLAAFVSACFLISGTWVTLRGQQWAGGFLGALGLGGIVTSFINGRPQTENKAPEGTETSSTKRKPKGKPQRTDKKA
jgi:uncharacterized membrane protein